MIYVLPVYVKTFLHKTQKIFPFTIPMPHTYFPAPLPGPRHIIIDTYLSGLTGLPAHSMLPDAKKPTHCAFFLLYWNVISYDNTRAPAKLPKGNLRMFSPILFQGDSCLWPFVSKSSLAKLATSLLKTALLATVTVLILGSGNPAHSELATDTQMQDVCVNWLNQSVARHGAWAGSANPAVREAGPVEKDGVLLARYYNIDPDGFVVVPILMEMSPIKMYYEMGHLDAADSDGLIQLLRDQLYSYYAAYVSTYGSAGVPQPDQGMFSTEHRDMWRSLAVPIKDFRASPALAVDSAGPLVTTSWHQSAPYNNYCPMGSGGRSVVGCVATAASQILRFWQWPDYGFGSHQYLWSGDNSCGGTPTPPQLLSVDLSDPYDWSNMRDSCDDGIGCNVTQQAALAELNYEVGVALNMDYGRCASGASQAMGLFALPYHFRYDWSIEMICRKYYDLPGWFGVIQQEIDAGRPIWYGIHSHEIVCDGYRTDGVTYEFHMNYGWGESHNAWYVLDNLYCSWVTGGICPYAMENMVIHIQPETGAFMTYSGSLLEETTGNGDGDADPGETWNILPVVENLGWEVSNAGVNLSTSDPYLNLTTPAANFEPTLARGRIDTASSAVELAISPGCPVPYLALLNVHVQEPGGFAADYPLVLHIGDTRGFEDYVESGPGLWTHRPVTERYADQWHVDTYRRHAGTASWKAGGPGAIEYADASDGGLVTPPILLAPNSRLSFWNYISAEAGATAGSAWDGGIVLISSDGVNWTKIYPLGGYPRSTFETGSTLNFDGSDGLYSGLTAWNEATFDLSAWSGEVRLMFRFGSDGAVTGEGWYLDDLWVGNTQEGVNVSVKAADSLTLTFGMVGGRGSTWAAISDSGPALPPLYSPVSPQNPRFFTPVTTSPVYGNIGVSIGYDASELTGKEKNLVLMAYTGGTWQNVTTSIDSVSNKVVGQISQLLPLVLLEHTSCCVGRVGDANGAGGDEPTIGDVSTMIDAKFITGTCTDIITCLPEADINQSGGAEPTCDDITIGDVATLIDYLFITGQSLGLPACL